MTGTLTDEELVPGHRLIELIGKEVLAIEEAIANERGSDALTALEELVDAVGAAMNAMADDADVLAFDLAAVTAERDALQRYADDVGRIIKDPAAVRINLLAGMFAKPDDLAFMHDTNGPVAELRERLAAAEAESAALWGAVDPTQARRALGAIADGYDWTLDDDGYVVVDNPAFRPDNGSDVNLVFRAAIRARAVLKEQTHAE